jgi:hypothetical protein
MQVMSFQKIGTEIECVKPKAQYTQFDTHFVLFVGFQNRFRLLFLPFAMTTPQSYHLQVRQTLTNTAFVALCSLTFLGTNLTASFAQKAPVKKPNPAAVSPATAAPQDGKIWLSLDVVEHQYNGSGAEIGKEKFRSDIEIQVIDSATNRSVSVHSGETVPLQARKTYFIFLPEIPQSYGMTTRLAGPQTQVLRTPRSVGDDDVMFERKFVLNSRQGSSNATSRELGTRTTIPPSAFPKPFPTTSPASSQIPAKPLGNITSSMSNPNYYVIQYCSLKSQEDALQARSFLMRNGIRDARVEVFIDKFGQSYYRLRSGSYIDPLLAKSTIEGTLWKNRQALGLKQKPIVVKAGV